MTATYVEEVNRGAAYLDEVSPGWYLNIDLDNLGMAHLKMCILGQTFGHFHNAPKFSEVQINPSPMPDLDWGVARMPKRYGWADDHGFHIALSPFLPHREAMREYTALGEVWKAEINRRRLADNGVAISKAVVELADIKAALHRMSDAWV